MITTSRARPPRRRRARAARGRRARAGCRRPARADRALRGRAAGRRDARARRHRAAHLHVGHDRAAQGRDEHARQRRVQRAGLPRLDRADERRRRARRSRRCSTSPGSSGTWRWRCSRRCRSCSPTASTRPRRSGWPSATARRSPSRAITAFIALLTRGDGGARPADADQGVHAAARRSRPRSSSAFEQPLRRATSTTSTASPRRRRPSHGVPFGAARAGRSDPGALSVGVPVFNTESRIVSEDGRELPAGRGRRDRHPRPAGRPRLLGEAGGDGAREPGGELRTGDVGFMDADGWFYLVDRKKDKIIASGYKVWPREVEDVLTSIPAVARGAVVGVPDPYRGETVKAFVASSPGATADAGRADRVRPRAHGGVQVPAPGRDRRTSCRRRRRARSSAARCAPSARLRRRAHA